jgi:hypothetical protein
MTLDHLKHNIIRQIISRGGLFGGIAAVYRHDEEKSDGFILECFEQCHHESLRAFWGNELVVDVIRYRVGFLRYQYELLQEATH